MAHTAHDTRALRFWDRNRKQQHRHGVDLKQINSAGCILIYHANWSRGWWSLILPGLPNAQGHGGRGRAARRPNGHSHKDPAACSWDTTGSPRAIPLNQTSSKYCVYQRQARHFSHVRKLIECQEQFCGNEAVLVRLLGRARGDDAHHLLPSPVLDGLLGNLLPSRSTSAY